MKNKTTVTLSSYNAHAAVSAGALQTLYENYQGGLIVLDHNYQLTYVNQQALGIFRADRIEDHAQLVNHLAAVPEIEELISASFTGRVSSVISSIIPNNIWHKYELSFFPMTTTPERVCSVGISIRERDREIQSPGPRHLNRDFEQGRFQTMSQFEFFMDNCPLTAWATDEQGTMLYVNKPFEQFTGLGSDIIGKTLFEIFPREMASVYHQNNLDVLEAGRTVEAVEKVIGPDGRQLITKVYKFPFTVNGSRIIGGWSVDITPYIDLQEQLAESIERYNYVNMATSDAIYDWDLIRESFYAGKGFSHVLGREQIRPTLLFCKKFLHPHDLRNVASIMIHKLYHSRDDRWEIRYRIKEAGGGFRHVVDKAFIIRSGGKAVRVIGALQDVTEQIQLQEKLVEQEKNNSREVLRQVIEAQENERESLSKELHDNVNQILSSCKLMLEAACDLPENGPVLTRRCYDSIQTVIAEIRRISHNLSPYTIDDITLVDAISQLAEDINLSGRIGVRFDHKLDADPWILGAADKMALYRIVQELLNNVLKHSKATQVWIFLSKYRNAVLVEVTDDGVGFREGDFRQGIGFRNIRNRIHNYEGRLEVVPNLQKGSQVRVSLTLKDPLPARAPTQAWR